MKRKQRMSWLPMACLMLLLGVVSMAIPSKAASADDFEYFYDGDDEYENQTWSITKYTGSDTEVTIPSEYDGRPVTGIESGAFSDCKNLKRIRIPASVIYISAPLGGDLESITVDEGNPKYYSEGNCLIERSSKTLAQGCKTSVIPNTITNIGYSAFLGCKNLVSITIPNSVTSIGVNAFSDCESLKSVSIPGTVTNIEQSAFVGCDNLTTFTVDKENPVYYVEDNCLITKNDQILLFGWKGAKISKNVKKVAEGAFAGNTSLEEITLPANIAWSYGMFYNCMNLKKVVAEDGVTSIPDFYGCTSLKEITIPSGVTTIGSFTDCISLESIIIPDGVKRIGRFSGCTSLKNITIPDSGTVIGGFENCTSLKEITIPGSATYSDYATFKDCTSLEEVVVESGAGTFPCFSGCTSLESITIPDSVTWIGGFKDCTSLREITIPNKVTWVGDFSGCTSLEKIEILSKVVKTVGGFTGCTSLKEITIPEGVTSIGGFSDCTSLESISIPDTVTKMGSFANCESLNAITIPRGVKTVGDFTGCTSLKEITIPKGVTTIGNFNDCTSLESISIPDTVTKMGNFANCKKLKAITIPYGVEMIGSFDNCESLIEVVIPDSVQDFGRFAQCKNLKRVVFPKHGRAFNYLVSRFNGCDNLSEIVFPDDSDFQIGYVMFYGCNGLTEVTLPENVKLEDAAFGYCKNLTKINIPSAEKTIHIELFEECSNLTDVSIPDGVTEIEDRAFKGCSKLTDITIPASVTKIADDAFINSGLTTVHAKAGSYAATWAAAHGYQVVEEGTDSNPDQTPSDTNPDQNTGKKPEVKGKVLAVTKYKCKVRVISDDVKAPKVEYLATTNKKATTIKVPDTVTVDGITYKVTAVAANALSGNKKVKKVVLGANVTSIGKNAFAKCKNLKSIQVKSKAWNKKSVGKNALKGTNKKLVVRVPKKKAAVYKKYLKGKGNKTFKVK